MAIERSLSEYLSSAKVGRLGTENLDRTVHLVPIVFANDRNRIYSVIDRKPKGGHLRRLTNIERTGRATLLVDRYSEDWSKLSFLILYCDAKILGPGQDLQEKTRASRLLKQKYTQYRLGKYFPQDLNSASFVVLIPKKFARWPQFLRANQG